MLCEKIIGIGLLLAASPLSGLFGSSGSAGIDTTIVGGIAAVLAVGADLLLAGLLFSSDLRRWLAGR